MATNRILLFGDSSDAPIPLVRQLLAKSRNSKNTRLFIQNVVEVVGRELLNFTPEERDSVGMVHSLQDLQECVDANRDRFGIARTILLLVARIGELILYVEGDSSILISSDNSSPVISLGICGSLLPAVAAACANDVDELIEVSTFLAGVACRVAVQIARRSIQIEDESGSWAFSTLGEIVTRLPSILEQFHENQAVPQYKQAYIAIQGASWATVFGPPSVLKKLVDSSSALKQSGIMTIPGAFGAIHAPHLTLPNLEYMVGETPLLDKRIKPNYKLISVSYYRPMSCSNFRGLLKEALVDIFQHTSNPERLFEAGISFLDRDQPTSLFVLGHTTYLLNLKRMLQKKRVKVALKSNSSTHENFRSYDESESVAIIGMSGRFPGADTTEELWTNVMERKEFHKKIPSNRFDVDLYLDPDGDAQNAISSPYGCFLDNPGFFDHKMFNISPREALRMDPGHRLLMHTTYEALEDAGVTNNGTLSTDSKRISTFIGIGGDDWREMQESLGVDMHMVGTERAFAPGRLNHYFNWEGATTCVDSACGSTATAVGLAYKSLLNGDCDTAIAGGSNIIATPFWHSALSKGGFLSPTGGCKTFREDADGYCRGEAVGVLVLKRLNDALQDGDNIISVIRGYARNHSADASSIMHPHVQTQERLYRSLLHKTGLEPQDIQYVECHGTGTTAGDSAELESIANVFAEVGSRDKPLVVGAIKANLGHSEATAGILSLIKATMVLQKETIPPQVGIPQKLGPYSCLKNGQMLVPENPISFSSPSNGQGQRRVLVNNFDAAGGNSCFVLEEPPKRQTKGSDPRAFHVITCSAHSPSSLHQNKGRLLQLLRENNNIDLANLAYTSTARRTHHALRASYCGDSIQSIIAALTKDLNNEDQRLSSRETKTPVVFIFSGQGGLYAGMGRELYKTSSQFRGLIADLEQMCDSLGFPPFTNLIADSSTTIESASVVQVHLSIVALQIALTELWKIWGLEPDVIMGHSIGEYAALYAAGVFSAFDALYLVGKRAQLIQSRCSVGTHAMLSISGTADEVALFLTEGNFMGCEVSCFNSPGMVVLSGSRAELLTLESSLKGGSFKCQLLDIPYAMHSRQMEPVLSGFGGILRGVQFGKPKVKIISTVLGHQVTEANLFGKDYLMKHTREPVKFQQAVSSCISQGLADTTSLWLEIGPNTTCMGLLRSNINVEPSNALTSLRKGQNDWKTISTNLTSFYNSGKLINWREYHKDFLDSLSHIDLPKYAFDTRDFWLTYKSNDQRSDPHGSVAAEHSKPEPLSTCLHYRLEHVDSEDKESASFTTTISYPPLTEIIQGHQLCGHIICPAAVFIDMALTAAQNLSSGEDFQDTHPFLCISDLQLDHAVVPTSEANQAIHIDIQRFKEPGTEFSVSFGEQSGSSPSTIGKCVVRLADRSAFDIECQNLSSSIQPMIARLTADSRLGVVDRLSGKLFYKLFSHLMSYSDMYKGVEAATVSNDFREIIADIRLPVHDRKRPDQRFNLSPYWTDIFGQSVGFLLNGNPDQAEDYVYIGTHIDRLDFQIENFPADARFRVYASIDSSEGPEYRGNAYILHGDIVVGISEGIRFRKMLRKNFHHLIGKVNGHDAENILPNKPSRTSKSSNGITAGQAASGKSNDRYNSNGHSLTLTTAFRQILLDETGLLESEVVPSAFFADVGVDSMMGISIFARLKSETGIELGASFLVENPTVGDAQRALRLIESQHSAIANGNALENGHKQEEPPTSRESNVVLISGRANSLSPKFLFLIADGAGSAAAYIHLPKLPDDVQIFALESPWIHDPENFTCTFNEAAGIYLAAIRRKQANGPYMLGGWSGGGVFAYEVARLLLQAGEKVSGLIIIDIPAPKYVNRVKVSVPTFEIIDQLGLLAGIDRAMSEASPQSLQLKNHMLSTVRCFSQLDPTPMVPGCQPDATFIIWATEMFWPEANSIGNSNPNGPNLDAWFYPSKHDFGYNGWNLLIGDKVECFRVQGDHFSIMNPPQVEQLGQIMQQLVIRCLNSVK